MLLSGSFDCVPILEEAEAGVEPSKRFFCCPRMFLCNAATRAGSRSIMSRLMINEGRMRAVSAIAGMGKGGDTFRFAIVERQRRTASPRL